MSELTNLYVENIQKKPSFEKKKSFLWADYIELLCMVNKDGELSYTDIIDRFQERERDLAESYEDDLEDMIDLEKEDNDKPTRRAEISIQWENDLYGWFNVLFYRQELYKEAYPFTLSDKFTNKIIKRKSEQQSNQQKLYLYFLLCSHLNLFDNSTRTILTSSFEMVSFNAFKNLLPQQAEVHMFGKNSLNAEGKFKDGSLWQKINLLSTELNEVLDPRLNENNYKQNSGDGGLDLVGWIPTGDSLPSSIIYFAQCACTEKEWKSKQHDASHQTWSQRILFKNYTNNNIFIPFCFRQSDGTWFQIEDIHLSFLIDRKRLLHYYYQKENISFDTLPAYKIVEEIIDARESIF